MPEFLGPLVDWTLAWANSSYSYLALFLLAFAESSFFPVPPDLLLIALALINPGLSLILAAICTIGSVLGGMFGYLIGLAGGRPILEKFVSGPKIKIVGDCFQKYEAWAIGIAAFTPVPYKVFTIAGGVFHINFLKFVYVSVLGRGGRFFLVAAMITLFGERIKQLMEKYFDIFSIIFVVLLIGGFYVFRKLASGKMKAAVESGGSDGF